jgi:dienelactone hydrolase
MTLRWLRRVGLIALVLGGCLYWASCTTAPILDAGVTKEVRRLSLAGRVVSVTLYQPSNRPEAPLVVVAHGFTRSKRYMAGWGADLAAKGFLVAVPTQPAFANHEINGQALAELVQQLRQNRRVALMGFSMGGLTTLLATQRTTVDAWVGLDPVDMNGSGVKAAAAMQVPCAVLRAEPEAWNMQGNARSLLKSFRSPLFAIKVRGATHLDAESPTDLLGQLASGFVDADRQALFKRYAIAFLQATLMHDEDARQLLLKACQDPGLAEVVTARLEEVR